MADFHHAPRGDPVGHERIEHEHGERRQLRGLGRLQNGGKAHREERRYEPAQGGAHQHELQLDPANAAEAVGIANHQHHQRGESDDVEGTVDMDAGPVHGLENSGPHETLAGQHGAFQEETGLAHGEDPRRRGSPDEEPRAPQDRVPVLRRVDDGEAKAVQEKGHGGNDAGQQADIVCGGLRIARGERDQQQQEPDLQHHADGQEDLVDGAPAVAQESGQADGQVGREREHRACENQPHASGALSTTTQVLAPPSPCPLTSMQFNRLRRASPVT